MVWADEAETVKTNNKARTKGQEIIKNVLVKGDWEHGIIIEDYKSKRKTFRDQQLAWEENKAKYYYLV